MLVGNFKHTIDAKGRVFLPAKYREDLGESIVLIKGTNDCLSAYSENGWKKVVDGICASLDKAMVNDAKRRLMFNAQLIEPDAQGRIIISFEMREKANLTKDITFLGMDSFVEIWDSQKLLEINSTETNDVIDSFLHGFGL